MLARVRPSGHASRLLPPAARWLSGRPRLELPTPFDALWLRRVKKHSSEGGTWSCQLLRRAMARSARMDGQRIEGHWQQSHSTTGRFALRG